MSTLLMNTHVAIKLLLLMVTSCHVFAQPLSQPAQTNGSKNETQVVPKEIAEVIYTRLRQTSPNLTISNLRSSPIPEIYRVDINNQSAFVSKSGEFFIAGEMYQVLAKGVINLQEQEREEKERINQPQRAKKLAAIAKQDMVIFSPENQVKGHIYVFTDIDCGYCRRFHGQMDDMLNKGIEVRYLAFPRAGVHSRSAQKLATVWCAKDPGTTMTRFKKGENVTLSVCDNHPVAQQYDLGNDIGVTGTPAIVLESGKIIPGAVSPKTLTKAMGI